MAISRRSKRPVKRTELILLSTITLLLLLALCSFAIRSASQEQSGPDQLFARSTSDENIEVCRMHGCIRRD